MKILIKSLIGLLLLTCPLTIARSETSSDITLISGGNQQWQIKIVLYNNYSDAINAPNGYKYWGCIYPFLLLPYKYPVIWRVYYKTNAVPVPENPAALLALWQRIHAWHEAEKEFYRSKVANSNLAGIDDTLKKANLDKIIQAGLRFFKQAKIAEARDKLKEGILIEPNDGVITILYGHTLFGSGNYTLAAKALRRGMGLINDFVSTPMDLREFYDKPETLDKQITMLETWIKYHPKDIEARFLLGYVCFFTRRLDQAIDTYKLLLELNPLDSETGLLLKKATKLVEEAKTNKKE